jgi:hypothetical protein
MTDFILSERQLKVIKEHMGKNQPKEKKVSNVKDEGLHYMTEIFGGKVKVNVLSENKK